MSLHDFLRDWTEHRDVSAVAECLGVNRTTVWRYVTGKTMIPLRALRALAAMVEASPSEVAAAEAAWLDAQVGPVEAA